MPIEINDKTKITIQISLLLGIIITIIALVTTFVEAKSNQEVLTEKVGVCEDNFKTLDIRVDNQEKETAVLNSKLDTVIKNQEKIINKLEE